MSDPPIDLDNWTPSGMATVDFAVSLLRSIHLPEIVAAEAWLLAHPDVAEPRLVAALETPAAQAAAPLLGMLGRDDSIAPLLTAHARGGEGLRAAVERGLAIHPSEKAEAALASIRSNRDTDD
jgi:hypothetical protein